jgi:hypothetical protein
MIKLLSLGFITLLLFLGTAIKKPVAVSLPNIPTNVYLDSFALHWSIPGKPFRYFENQKNKPEVIIEMRDLFSDMFYTSYSTTDTVIVFPAQAAKKFGVTVCLTDAYRECTAEYMLDQININPVIEDLRNTVLKNPSVQNFMLLAKAYEKERCYVNEIFIINKISQIDRQTGDQLWEEYAKLYPQVRNSNDASR